MNDVEKKLKRLKNEDIIWIVYFFIVVFALYSNKLDRDYLLKKDKDAYKREKSINIQQGKLSDNQKDDIEEATKNLKIVNNIEKKIRSQIAAFFYIKQKALRKCVRIYDKIKKENSIAFYVKLC